MGRSDRLWAERPDDFPRGSARRGEPVCARRHCSNAVCLAGPAGFHPCAWFSWTFCEGCPLPLFYRSSARASPPFERAQPRSHEHSQQTMDRLRWALSVTSSSRASDRRASLALKVEPHLSAKQPGNYALQREPQTYWTRCAKRPHHR